MTPALLERRSETEALGAAAERVLGGQGGCTALVCGEAGIGKTSLVKALVAQLASRVRLLAGACEDLLTPRALGPLRDAVRGTTGPLHDALAHSGDPDRLFAAVAEQLVTHPTTLLVIEDAQWADDATLDVLRYTSRRVHELNAIVVVTYRDDELTRDHPLRAYLGSLSGDSSLRLKLAPLTPAAVGELAARHPADADEVFRLTRGNPFFVTEALATTEAGDVPPTVVDAVLARVMKLSRPAQQALDLLAVGPSGMTLDLLGALLPDLSAVEEAESAGVLELRGDLVCFRHELARRAVVQSLPTSARRGRSAEVLRALLSRPESDPFTVLHHALGAGDDNAVVEYGTLAGKEAQRLGAHAQAVSAYGAVLERADLLSQREHASVCEAYSWVLGTSNRLHEAAAAAEAAVGLWRTAGDDAAIVRAMVTLSRQQWLIEDTTGARRSAATALKLAESDGRSAAHALALLDMGGTLVLVDREVEGLAYLSAAIELAEALGAVNVAALSHNYRGSARLQLGDLDGEQELLLSVQLAREARHREYVMRGYYNLIEGLWRLGHLDRACAYIDTAEEYGRDGDFRVHRYMFAARRFRRMAMRGRWSDAVSGYRQLLDGRGDPGMIGRETLPILARLLVRQDAPGAERILREASEHAERADVLEWLVPTGLARLEHAWLAGDPSLAGGYPRLLLERTDRPGCLVQRGEVLRYLRRLGHPAEPFAGCPGAYDAGLRGDWEAAAAAWAGDDGDPYERALELMESGQVDPTLEALDVLDRLGARPAARLARERLRQLGVRRVPRGPQPTTLANPAGLTPRQAEILDLVALGRSNAEIAGQLHLSTRTVDHHVAAVLQRLGVPTRRAAAEAHEAMSSTPPGP